MSTDEPVRTDAPDPEPTAEEPPVEPLPEPVRRTVLALAAAALGAMPGPEVPPMLTRVRAFTPARRAAAGAGPLTLAMEQVPAFRARVAALWREAHPELVEDLRQGRLPDAARPDDVLAGLFLLRPEGWTALDRRVRAARTEPARTEPAGPVAGGDRAEAAAGSEPARAGTAGPGPSDRVAALAAELVSEREAALGLRKELRRARADADRARSRTREAEAEVEALRSRLTEALEARDDVERRAREEVSVLRAELDATRRSARDGRSLTDSRVRLLLETVAEAAAGLRRELALPADLPAPADLVGPALGGSAGEGDPVPTRAGQDAGRLRDLLSLPRVHLVVDGYNVSKTAFAAMALADQRKRLVDGLAALAARTGAEITCCFDGAVTEGRTASRARGVRVLFSDPGVTADDLIRRLVRAEPPGRVVVVASSDAEVAGRARASGAYPVASGALAALLGPR